MEDIQLDKDSSGAEFVKGTKERTLKAIAKAPIKEETMTAAFFLFFIFFYYML
jgi:hypothetical protein